MDETYWPENEDYEVVLNLCAVFVQSIYLTEILTPRCVTSQCREHVQKWRHRNKNKIIYKNLTSAANYIMQISIQKEQTGIHTH
jgi:hypothetical protein